MAEEDVLYTKQGAIATITLNRPQIMNAVNWGMHDLIARAIDDASRDDEIRVLILTGAGRGFCSGTDVTGGLTRPAADSLGQSLAGERTRPGFTFTNVPKPTIAAVNGAAVGMGAEFAIQCDIRIASDRARFGWVFPLRGLVPDTGAGTYLLPKIVGVQKAFELLYTGEIIDAQEAERIGLVVRVVPHDDLEAATMELATKIAKVAPLSNRWTKQLVYRGMERTLEVHLAANSQLLNMCFQTEDHREGIQSFLEKREAVFKGK